MHWNLEMLEHMLELYKTKKMLWDPRHPQHNNKAAKEGVYQWIAEQLEVPNLTGEDVSRKLRTMRAAYQVELRNISTGKARGFFYNPTLKWFHMYKSFMDAIDALKYKYDPDSGGDDISLEEDEVTPNTYVLRIKEPIKGYGKKRKRATTAFAPREPSGCSQAEMFMDPREINFPLKEVVSDDSSDEFQSFADHIAEQLRSMRNLPRALLIENHILRILDKERKRHRPN